MRYLIQTCTYVIGFAGERSHGADESRCLPKAWWHARKLVGTLRAICTQASQYAFHSSSELSVSGVSIRLLLPGPATASQPVDGTAVTSNPSPSRMTAASTITTAPLASSSTSHHSAGAAVGPRSLPRQAMRPTQVSKLYRHLHQQRPGCASSNVKAAAAATSRGLRPADANSGDRLLHSILTQWGFQVKVTFGDHCQGVGREGETSQPALHERQPALTMHGCRSKGLSSLGAPCHARPRGQTQARLEAPASRSSLAMQLHPGCRLSLTPCGLSSVER